MGKLLLSRVIITLTLLRPAPNLIIVFSLFCLSAIGQQGAQVNPTGNPIGGGNGYSHGFTSGDFTVGTTSQLLQALNNANSGDIIYILHGSTINLSSHHYVEIPAGVTLAGNRGFANSLGPMIITNNLTSEYLFNMKNDSRITGIRIRGADVDIEDITYPISPFPSNPLQSNAKAIAVRGDRVEVDNCEIFNFHRAGIDCQTGDGINIHHNYLHDIHAYPVLIADFPRTPYPKIVANKIEFIWHAVASVGHPSTGFEVRYNEIKAMPTPVSWYSQGMHAIDIHPDNEIRYSRGDYIACSLVKVYNNTFIDNFSQANHPSVEVIEDLGVRGVPREGVYFYDNISYNTAETSVKYEFSPWKGNTWVYSNIYDGVLHEVNPLSTSTILFESPAPPSISIPIISTQVIPIDIVVIPYPSRTIQSVIIKIDGSTIYSGNSGPGSGNLAIHKNQLSSSLPYHALDVEIIDNTGTASFSSTVFKVQSTFTDCTTNLNLQGQTIGNGLYRAQNLISSNNSLSPNLVSVNFAAGQKVELSPGFSTNKGTLFKIEIKNCAE